MKKSPGQLHFRFFMLYALIYGGNSIITTFMPVYLKDLSFNNANIGLILAIGPLIAIFAQPFWGITADRSKYKNTTLQILLISCAMISIIYTLNGSFYYILIVYSALMFFYAPIFSTSDSITLESIEGTKLNFSVIRLGGTIGYMIVVLATGYAAGVDTKIMFLIYSSIALASFSLIFTLPKIKGHQFYSKAKAKAGYSVLLKNKELVLILSYHLLIQITLGFFYSFFPIFLFQMGAGLGLIGLAFMISASSEIPILIFAHKILNKIGIKNMLLLSGTITGIRWLLLSFTTQVSQVLATQVLHSMGFAALVLTTAIYINKNVPNELKASGQSLNTLTGVWIPRVLGSVLGGVISQMISLKQIFFILSLICFTAIIVFYILRNKFDPVTADENKQQNHAKFT